MILANTISLCQKNQKKIISSEKGRSHVALNSQGKFEVRHYRLDGEIVQNQTCCDFLLANDTSKKAYYIELKGQDIRKAVMQVLAAEKLCDEDLSGYLSHYRIIPSKAKTEELHSTEYRRLLQKVGTNRLKCKSTKMEEILN